MGTIALIKLLGKNFDIVSLLWKEDIWDVPIFWRKHFICLLWFRKAPKTFIFFALFSLRNLNLHKNTTLYTYNLNWNLSCSHLFFSRIFKTSTHGEVLQGSSLGNCFALGWVGLPKRMNFRIRSKRSLTPPPLWGNYVAFFYWKTSEKKTI